MLKMEDIAKMAGVSRSAVSLAINGKPGVSKKTREKIFNVINENNYVPLRKHHGDKTHKLSQVTFLIITDHRGMVKGNYRALPFFDNLLSTLTDGISSYGGSVQIHNIESDKLKKGVLDLVENKKLKNFVVLATDLSKEQIIFLKEHLGVSVFVDTYYDDVSADFVTMDNFQGAYQAAEYILSKGYKNVGYVASNKLISNFQNRRRGFYQAMKDHNQEVAPDHFYSISPMMKLADSDELKEMLKDQHTIPDALFCEDDYIAIRLIKELTSWHIRVPEDIAVMGFDDIYAGTMISPELTTIHVPIQQISSQALFQLQQQAADKFWQPQKSLVSTRIVKRDSV
ncbi:LacI family transcriptional regulator [Lactobacillus colini]|uniref:LacI family transcriptional regulator n=1 Tax=Lactobacillus colini TaxID=1819254 RepID=A0ABS4MFK7_9LACO|nr:LacI family DNA-binding transcriptional regulator [Lactobacillus colini]MBP2058470.1 LacI family transcriptional regulator [Lactobacillus colini]